MGFKMTCFNLFSDICLLFERVEAINLESREYERKGKLELKLGLGKG